MNTETKASESEEGQAENQVKTEQKDTSEEKPESMDTSDAKNTSAEEEQLDDPLDDKTESPKIATAAASVKDDKDNTSARSFWVRGLSSTTKAADIRVCYFLHVLRYLLRNCFLPTVKWPKQKYLLQRRNRERRSDY